MPDLEAADLEISWKRYTLNGNAFFDQKSWHEAAIRYEKALYYAEKLNIRHQHCLSLGIPYVQIFIISCNNLANTYSEINKIEQTEKLLERAVFYLIHQAEINAVDQNTLENELKKAVLSLLTFLKNNNLTSKQAQLFELLKQPLFSNTPPSSNKKCVIP